jgi:hypothetical protein
LLQAQNDLLQDLVNRICDMDERLGRDNDGTHPDLLCGEWYSRKLGVSIIITKGKDGYYARIGDTGALPEDFGMSYPIICCKDRIYFVLDGHVIFIEYKADVHEIILCGKLSLLGKTAKDTLYPAFPFDYNYNPN